MSVRVKGSSSTTRIGRGGSILAGVKEEEEGLLCVNWSKTVKFGDPVSLGMKVDEVGGRDISSTENTWRLGKGTNVGR